MCGKCRREGFEHYDFTAKPKKRRNPIAVSSAIVQSSLESDTTLISHSGDSHATTNLPQNTELKQSSTDHSNPTSTLDSNNSSSLKKKRRRVRRIVESCYVPTEEDLLRVYDDESEVQLNVFSPNDKPTPPVQSNSTTTAACSSSSSKQAASTSVVTVSTTPAATIAVMTSALTTTPSVVPTVIADSNVGTVRKSELGFLQNFVVASVKQLVLTSGLMCRGFGYVCSQLWKITFSTRAS